MSGEFDRISDIRHWSARKRSGIVLGIGDDAALLAARPGFDTVVSSDLLVESVHFRLDWSSPEHLGHKSMAVSLSDMAAMGAEPCAAVVSLAIPAGVDDAFLEGFYRGATTLLDRYGASIVGGDLSRSPSSIVIDSVLVGHVEEGRSLRRDGARPGQDIYVSGSLGTSSAGLSVLEGDRADTSRVPIDDANVRAHLLPEPRVALGRALVERRLASAAIDISDGLSSDLRHICVASRVGALIDDALVPAPAGLERALHGGEQYELVFAASQESKDAIEALALELKLPLSRIGSFEESLEGVWIESGGARSSLTPSGFDHFRQT